MKMLAWIANISLITTIVWLFFKHGFPNDGEEILFVLLSIVAPTISCLAMASADSSPFQDGEEGIFVLANKALRAKLKKAARESDDG